NKAFLSRPGAVRRLTKNSSLTSVFLSTAPTATPNAVDPLGVTEHSEVADTSFLAADTGNNRVVGYNPAGNAIWELKEFNDPFRLLPAGEPRTLNSPRDAQRWVDTEQDPLNPTGPLLLVFHTLVADTSNTRLLEIVDKIRYNAGYFTATSFVTLPNQVDFGRRPVPWYHVLVWASQTNGQGLRLKYSTAQRIFWTDATGNYVSDPGYQPGVASTSPPYLSRDQFVTTTLCTVN